MSCEKSSSSKRPGEDSSTSKAKRSRRSNQEERLSRAKEYIKEICEATNIDPEDGTTDEAVSFLMNYLQLHPSNNLLSREKYVSALPAACFLKARQSRDFMGIKKLSSTLNIDPGLLEEAYAQLFAPANLKGPGKRTPTLFQLTQGDDFLIIIHNLVAKHSLPIDISTDTTYIMDRIKELGGGIATCLNNRLLTAAALLYELKNKNLATDSIVNDIMDSFEIDDGTLKKTCLLDIENNAAKIFEKKRAPERPEKH